MIKPRYSSAMSDMTPCMTQWCGTIESVVKPVTVRAMERPRKDHIGQRVPLAVGESRGNFVWSLFITDEYGSAQYQSTCSLDLQLRLSSQTGMFFPLGLNSMDAQW